MEIRRFYQFGAHDSVDVAKDGLRNTVRDAEQDYPGFHRHLRLGIEGHRTVAGEFDDDVRELWRFIVVELMPYLTSMRTPWGNFDNCLAQRNDVERLFMP